MKATNARITNYMLLPCPQANFCSGSAVAAARLYGGRPRFPSAARLRDYLRN